MANLYSATFHTSAGWFSETFSTSYTSATTNGNGWIHVVIPNNYPSSDGASVSRIGFKLTQNRTGYNLSGMTHFHLDNLILIGNTNPPRAVVTMSIAEASGKDWTDSTACSWSDGLPAWASPASTHEVLGAGARIRSPSSSGTFPAAVLQVDGDGKYVNSGVTTLATISELRTKAGAAATYTITNLVMNGGQIDFNSPNLGYAGPAVTLQGGLTVTNLSNAPLYNNASLDYGPNIAAYLAGAGNIEIHGYQNSTFQTSYTNAFIFSCATNAYTGTWNVAAGVLLGSGTNALGTNTITIGANGALETTYDINNPNGGLVLNGRMSLHQNDTFASVTVNGVALAPGTYPFAALNSAYPANFPASWTKQNGSSFSTGSGSLKVGATTTTTTSVSSSANPATYGSAVTFTATVAGGVAPTGNVTINDGATVLGAAALNGSSQATLTTNLAVGSHSITAVYAGDANNSGSTSAVLTQSVTPASLTVTGLLALDKVYDGTTNATMNAANATLVGVLNSDNVTLNVANAAAVFADADVGANKTVTVSGLALAGSAPGNYVLQQPVYLTASILPLLPPAFLNQPTFGSAGFELTFQGQSGQSFELFSTSSLSQPNWQMVTNGIFGDQAISFTDASATSNTMLFYKLVSP